MTASEIGNGINLGEATGLDRGGVEDAVVFELDFGGEGNTTDFEFDNGDVEGADEAEKTCGWEEDTPVSNLAIFLGCSLDSFIYRIAVSSFFQPCFRLRSTEVAPCI